MTDARATRIQMYSEWVRSDADGLLYQLRGPATQSEIQVLREARANIKAALELVEHRIANVESADVVAR
jgi:hypothetical protein